MSAIGTAFFADPKMPKDGFFCNGNGPTAITGIHELPTDVVWVTNIRPHDFMQGGYGQLRHLRSSNFFRTDVSFMIRELGLEGDLAEASEALFKVFKRSLAVLQDRMDIDISKCRLGLRQEVTAQMVPMDISASLDRDASLFEACRQSIQYNQGRASSTDIPRGSKIHSFVLPRSALASFLLSLPLPSSMSWSPVSFRAGVLRVGSANGRSSQDKSAETSFENLLLASRQKQFLLDIDINEIDRRYLSYRSFGVGDRTTRRWACAEEVAEISRFSIVDIRGGWATDRNEKPLACPDMPPEFSFSRSLANEIYWLGIASNRDSTSPSVWAAYLRAVERIVLGRAADEFAKRGYCVGSYGTGRINVFLRSGEHKSAVELALALGLIPPFSIVPDNLAADKVAFKPKLYYRSDLLDETIHVNSFVEHLESDWLRMFITGVALGSGGLKDVQAELDSLIDLPDDRRLKHFEGLVEEHLSELPQPVEVDDDGGEDPDEDNLVF